MAYSSVANLTEKLGQNGGTSSAIDTTGADLIAIVVAYYDIGTTPTMSDSKSNTWTATTVRSDGITKVCVYYCVAPTAGSGHTFTASGSGIFCSIGVSAWSGSKQTSPVDAQAGSGGTTNSLTPGSVTPSEDNELVLSGVVYNSGTDPTIDSGFTRIGYQDYSAPAPGPTVGVAHGYLIQTSAGAANPTWSFSTTDVVAGSNVTFKAAAAGGSIVPVLMRQYRARG